jgi:ferredoxin
LRFLKSINGIDYIRIGGIIMESKQTILNKGSSIGTISVLPSLLSSFSNIEAKVPVKSKMVRTAAVLWYSQTGNTRKCGRAVAKSLNREGVYVTESEIRDFDPTYVTDFDLIVIGSPVFYYDIPYQLKEVLQSFPDLNGVPVAAYVTFGGVEGNQHNAACSILEELTRKNGVPVGLRSFQSTSSFSIGFKDSKPDNNRLPDKKTFEKAYEYARDIKSEVEKGNSSNFKKTLTLKQSSICLGPMWWTKQFVNKHLIVENSCTGCGICIKKCPAKAIDPDTFSVDSKACVLCLGCVNNCENGAVHMEYNSEKVIGFKEYLKRS